MAGRSGFWIQGTLLHTPRRGELEVIEDGLVEVDAGGRIAALSRPRDPDYRGRRAAAMRSGGCRSLSATEFLLPGLVDLHVHAPQWPQAGKALDLPLERWLREHTFPLEARYADTAFARSVYDSLVATLLGNGTTTAVYYATLHVEATKALADACLERGQRAFVGRVAMDHPELCPDDYRDPSAEEALDRTRAFIEYARGLGGGGLRVVPVVTPRFVPACTDALLAGLGALARETGCPVQTHCSESDWEHAHVLRRCGRSDARALEELGLLTPHGVLAHAVFASDGDMTAIDRAGAGIAHCPLSNLYLSNAVFPARRALDRGLRIGLGTDLAGGPEPSLLRTCRTAVAVSRAREEGVDASLAAGERGVRGARIDLREAFWMATAGGAEVLGLEAGRFEQGCAFDAFVADASVQNGNVALWRELDSAEDAFEKLVCCAGRENVTAVWVQGARVR